MKALSRTGQLQVQALSLLNAIVAVQRTARTHAINNTAMAAPVETLRAQLVEITATNGFCEFFLYETVCVLNGVIATPDLPALGLVREVSAALNGKQVGGFRIMGTASTAQCQAMVEAILSGRIGMDARYGFEVTNVAVIVELLQRLHEQEVATIQNRDPVTQALTVYAALLSVIEKSVTGMRSAGEVREGVSTSRVLREAVDTALAVPDLALQLALLREARLQYALRHLVGTTFLAILVGHELTLSRPELMHLARVALFHDVAVSVYGEHLEQVRDLGPADRKLVQEMPLLSARAYLRRRALDFETLRAVIAAIECKRPFNDPLTPEAMQSATPMITFASRIVQVCAAFDAMTSDRPFRPALPITAAVDALAASSARYDPRVLIALMRVLAGVKRAPAETTYSGYRPA